MASTINPLLTIAPPPSPVTQPDPPPATPDQSSPSSFQSALDDAQQTAQAKPAPQQQQQAAPVAKPVAAKKTGPTAKVNPQKIDPRNSAKPVKEAAQVQKRPVAPPRDEHPDQTPDQPGTPRKPLAKPQKIDKETVEDTSQVVMPQIIEPALLKIPADSQGTQTPQATGKQTAATGRAIVSELNNSPEGETTPVAGKPVKGALAKNHAMAAHANQHETGATEKAGPEVLPVVTADKEALAAPAPLLPSPSILGAAVAPPAAPVTPVHASATVQPVVLPSPNATFVQANYPQIVGGIHGQLIPGGGMMQLRLDPPELGDLQISVHMRDGVMTAAFQTSSDEATRLISHNLSQLKGALESAGISVEKLHVTQAPRNESGNNQGNDKGRDSDLGQRSAQQEQQRKEMLRRLWRKLSGGDPLDLVA